MGRYLNATGRPMVYSCSWPAYQRGKHPNYTTIAQHCNLWRSDVDVQDSWKSVLDIIDYYGEDCNNESCIEHAGPGHWNDPDMVLSPYWFDWNLESNRTYAFEMSDSSSLLT